MTAMAAVFVAVHIRSLTPERHKAPQVCPPLRVRPWWRRVNRVQKKPKLVSAPSALNSLGSRVIFLTLATLMIDRLT